MTGRRWLVLLVVGGLTLGALSGCGGGDDPKRSGDGGGQDDGKGGKSDSGAAAYVGLTKQAAIAKADAAGTPWRITREDDETFMVTLDFNPDRLNFEIDDGTVTRARYG